MPDRSPALAELKQRVAEIHDLGRARAVLSWDERTMMPPGGAAARAEQLATLSRVLHERLASDGLARVLDQLRTREEQLPRDSDEASLIRVTRREHERALRVPLELKVELSRTGSIAEHAWEQARAESDFAFFLPHLERVVALKQRYAECFEPAHIYDPLIDDFDPGMTTAEADRLLTELKEAVLPLASAIAEHAGDVDDSALHGHFDVEAQRRLSLEIVRALPLPPGTWRLDLSKHPFATSFSTSDVRITTRYSERYLGTSMFSTLHELGHGLYDNGLDPELERSQLGRPASLAVHESQSRMWENMVGRGLAFCRNLHPQLLAIFPEQFERLDADGLHRAVNKVQPSLIRTEADEVTYDLHIILRFELEREMIAGRLAMRELPEAWNERIRSYLGLKVPSDALGVLQDPHWSDGSFGYFPTYSLGNVIAGQLWQAVRAEIPDLDEQIEEGRLAPLRDWLREHVHRHGRKFSSDELLERVTGRPIEVTPYVDYLRRKFSAIYALV
jgi:carboxypeptidase Taq